MGQVTAVVCAAFDSRTDVAIEAVRSRIVALDPRIRAPGDRPHVTLAAAQLTPGAELDQLLAVVGDLAARHSPLPLTFAEVGSFPRAGVLWLGPSPSSSLRALQRDAAASLLGAGWPESFGEQSDPQRWVPHCTVARGVPRTARREVLDAARAACAPVRSCVDELITILVGRGVHARVPLTGRSGQ